MKQKIFAMLLALLVMAVSVPALAAESDNNGSNYQWCASRQVDT